MNDYSVDFDNLPAFINHQASAPRRKCASCNSYLRTAQKSNLCDPCQQLLDKRALRAREIRDTPVTPTTIPDEAPK
jgi:hypothetical protein